MIRFTVLCAALALAGCVGRPLEPARVITVCPVLKAYSPEFQKQVATELKSNPPPGMAAMIRDYGGLRAQVRACEARRKP